MYCNPVRRGEEPPTYDDDLLFGTMLLFSHFNELLGFAKEYISKVVAIMALVGVIVMLAGAAYLDHEYSKYRPSSVLNDPRLEKLPNGDGK